MVDAYSGHTKRHPYTILFALSVFHRKLVILPAVVFDRHLSLARAGRGEKDSKMTVHICMCVPNPPFCVYVCVCVCVCVRVCVCVCVCVFS